MDGGLDVLFSFSLVVFELCSIVSPYSPSSHLLEGARELHHGVAFLLYICMGRSEVYMYV